MKLLRIIAIAVVSAAPSGLIFCQTQPTLPSPAYVVHSENARATAMSPDEKYLAIFVVKDAVAEVQVWNFLSGILVQAHGLPTPELRPKYREPTN
jgi:hypothetical protein